MSFNASNYGVAEGQYNPVVGVQAPVQDNSDAMAISSIASGVDQLGESAFAIKGAHDRQRVSELEAETTRMSSAFSDRTNKIAYAVSSGEKTQEWADVQMGLARDEARKQGLSAADLEKAEIRSLKTLHGRALLEKSKQEQLEDVEWTQYVNSEWALPSDASLKEHKSRIAEQMESEGKDLQLAARKRAVELKRADKDLSTFEKEQADSEAEELAVEEINHELTTFTSTAPKMFIEIGKAYQQERLTIGEPAARANAERAVEAYELQVLVRANQSASKSKTGAPIQLERLTDTVTRYKSQLLDNLGDARLAKKVTEIQAEQKALTSFAILNSSEDAKVYSVAKDIFGPEAALTFTGLRERAATGVNKFVIESAKREIGGPTLSLEVGSEEEAALFKLMEGNLKAFSEGTYEGSLESLDKGVSGQLAHLAHNIPNMQTGQVNQMLKGFESPAFGEYVKARKLTNEDLDNAKRAIFNHKEKVADNTVTFIKEQVDKLANRNRSRTKRGAIMAEKAAELSDLELVFDGGVVSLRALTPNAKNEAKEISEMISKPLTRIVRVDANLSGKSQEQMFNAWKEEIWPDEEATQGVDTQVDYSKSEGEEMVDEEDNIWIITNGIPTPTGRKFDGT